MAPISVPGEEAASGECCLNWFSSVGQKRSGWDWGVLGSESGPGLCLRGEINSHHQIFILKAGIFGFKSNVITGFCEIQLKHECFGGSVFLFSPCSWCFPYQASVRGRPGLNSPEIISSLLAKTPLVSIQNSRPEMPLGELFRTEKPRFCRKIEVQSRRFCFPWKHLRLMLFQGFHPIVSRHFRDFMAGKIQAKLIKECQYWQRSEMSLQQEILWILGPFPRKLKI